MTVKARSLAAPSLGLPIELSVVLPAVDAGRAASAGAVPAVLERPLAQAVAAPGRVERVVVQALPPGLRCDVPSSFNRPPILGFAASSGFFVPSLAKRSLLGLAALPIEAVPFGLSDRSDRVPASVRAVDPWPACPRPRRHRPLAFRAPIRRFHWRTAPVVSFWEKSVRSVLTRREPPCRGRLGSWTSHHRRSDRYLHLQHTATIELVDASYTDLMD